MIKKKLFHLPPVQAAISLTAKGLSAGKGTDVHNVDSTPLGQFKTWLAGLNAADVLELGTRRTSGRPSTSRKEWLSPTSKYIASDFEDGLDVDVVANAEKLSETFGQAAFDAVIACSVFEHIRRPWLAAAEIARVLKPGGIVFVQTHHTFPLHAYPFDYWRFSREALETLFDSDFKDQATWYDFPASVLSHDVPALAGQQAFLNVNIIAKRV